MSLIKFKFPKSIEKEENFEFPVTDSELQSLKDLILKLKLKNLQAMRRKVIVFVEDHSLSPAACG